MLLRSKCRQNTPNGFAIAPNDRSMLLGEDYNCVLLSLELQMLHTHSARVFMTVVAAAKAAVACVLSSSPEIFSSRPQ